MHLYDADVASAPPVNSDDFWKRPERVTASSDPDEATAQTIRIMCQHVRTAAHDSQVVATARRAADQFGGLSGFGNAAPASLAESAWWWCKTFIKFVHHEFIIRQRLGEAGHLQGLIAPDVLIRMDRPEGDCAIFTECLCAFLRVFGIPYEMVTVAVNPREPEIFSHVYLYAVMPDGSRLPLDASHGTYPGWQVPSSDVSRRQVWDESGSPVADRGSRFDGLHNYVMRGVGDLIENPDGTVTDTTPQTFDVLPTDYYNPTQEFGSFGANPFGIPPSPGGGPGGTGFNWVDSGGAPYSGPTYTVPSQNSAQWASFAAQMAKGGLSLLQLQAIQPGTVLSANGAILRQNPGYSVPVGGGAALTSLTGGNTILYLGLAAVALFGLSMMGGRK